MYKYHVDSCLDLKIDTPICKCVINNDRLNDLIVLENMTMVEKSTITKGVNIQ